MRSLRRSSFPRQIRPSCTSSLHQVGGRVLSWQSLAAAGAWPGCVDTHGLSICVLVRRIAFPPPAALPYNPCPPLLLLLSLLTAGDDITSKQLRDDLMTLLIAGHETTAAVLTWTFHCVVDRPEIISRMRQEVGA